MAQASRENPGLGTLLRHSLGSRAREGGLILLVAIALYLLLSLASYQPGDPGWSHSARAGRILNRGGIVGAWLADVFLYLFGYLAYLFPAMVAALGWVSFRGIRIATPQAVDPVLLATRVCGFALTLAAGCGLAGIRPHPELMLPLDAGGVLGEVVSMQLTRMFNPLGATLFLTALFLTGFTLTTGISWLAVMDVTGRYTLRIFSLLDTGLLWLRELRRARQARKQRAASVSSSLKRPRKAPRIEPKITAVAPSVRAEKERQVPLFKADDPVTSGPLPALNLLDPAKPSNTGVTPQSLQAVSRQVELKLADFGIEVEVVAVHPGPVITRYELQLAPGLKVSRISNLAKDLARSLSTVSVRIVEVIPGKSVIGLEIPNEHREIVYLSEILRSAAYDAGSAPLPLALGKDIGGNPVVVKLGRMPHLLVAGTTGSGKSVAINAMILSLLYRHSAEEVRMIMIDPKMLELSVYEGIPHLLAPVVTDMKKASNALRWCVAEMEQRYQLMSALGVRNITGYNRKVREAAERGTPLTDPLFEPHGDDDVAPALERMPFIVIIVDELADMMMVTGKKVEELIARLAQKARAAGVHLILATQRPSVDVITGLIKANIPTRIAFQVSSRIDSRTILDQMGAEHLLGHGDMLFLAPGTGIPERVHGAFVGDAEVHRVVDSLKKAGAPRYADGVLDGSAVAAMEGAGNGSGTASDGESDPLYDEAVQIVTETRRASISGVQRRLKIGYNRAARMIEQMEQSGVVGNLQTNGTRDVLAPPPPAD